MNVTRPTFNAPVMCIDDFLPAEDAFKILQECIDLKKIYVPGSIFDGANKTTVNPHFRTNEVVHLDNVFRGASDRSDILRILKDRIWTHECRTLWHVGYFIFDVINYATSHEVVVSRYGNGSFYKRHQDTRRDNITLRLVSLVYYVNRVPQQFSGGSLRLWHDGENIQIEPKHNRAVVFPSFVFHEVDTVRSDDECWDQARFSVNYWLGFR
jgi:2OG-Fe(II) oxygenase superfamily